MSFACWWVLITDRCAARRVNGVSDRWDAVIVGAGPNGLTAAARLAAAGRRVIVFEAAPTIGGGSRTKELVPGVRVDVCASNHPFGASSPAFEELRLHEHGLAWAHAPVALAHPFDDGTAAMFHRDLGRTIAGLGLDGERWRSLVGWMAEDWMPRLRHLALGPLVAGGLRHPVALARFGLPSALPSLTVARLFRTPEARALIVGLSAHAGTLLTMSTTAGVALALIAATHAGGMPVAVAGSQAIAEALAAVVRRGGGELVCDYPVDRLAELPPAAAVLLDVTPHQAADLLGRPRPRWRRGVAAWKLDLVLREPMPWRAEACRGAGTIHLGGTAAEMATAERQTVKGGLPSRPYMIVTQPTVADPGRAPGRHVVWAYRHVPNGCVDPRATDGIEAQFDRYAPGWRDVVEHKQVTTAMGYAAYNRSYEGGDIAGGAMTPWQTVARPRLALDPYRTKVDGVWLCSQSTPPGPGVHGMCGWHAAGSVLRH